MRAKFKRGDPVRFTRRATKYATEGLRKRTRTVAEANYNSDDQCIYYRLGGWGKAMLDFPFRSYMLRLATRKEQRKMGKPRQKRRYNLHSKLLRSCYNPNQGEHPPTLVSLYPETPDLALTSLSATKTQTGKNTGDDYDLRPTLQRRMLNIIQNEVAPLRGQRESVNAKLRELTAHLNAYKITLEAEIEEINYERDKIQGLG